MPSPPKPWEVNNRTATAAISPSTAVAVSTNNVPDVPARSTALDSTTPIRPTSYTNTGYGSTGYGGYGSTGYGSGYGSSMGYGTGSSYNRYGMGGMSGMSSMGYGSYGGGYGSYGGGGYGMNRYGGGFGNRMGPGGPDDMPLTQRMEMGTRSTFEVIENVVGSFSGFAQMLDSTFMATHSSFMAMVGVAEQVGFLKNYLGQVFSIFALYRVAKRVINKLTGRQSVVKAGELNFMEFQHFEQKSAAAAAAPKMSRKPLIIFMLMIVGLPWMMHKLIKIISKNQQQQMAQNGMLTSPNTTALASIDPAKLEFARAMYDFTAESQMEITLKKGDIVAIISKTDPNTNATSQWWRGRLRDGTMGIFPANYVEIIQKNGSDNKNLAQDDALAALKETADTVKPIAAITPNNVEEVSV